VQITSLYRNLEVVFIVVMVEISLIGHLTNLLHYFIIEFSFFIIVIIMMFIDSIAIIVIVTITTVALSIFEL